MSGPVEMTDLEARAGLPVMDAPLTIPSRLATVGDLEVRRALPTRGHRTVGAWCFADHFGPAQVSDRRKPDIGPHPHMGLHTVTWLWAGQLLHRDSLGSEQLIRPGQLNLMTAGHGVAHAEESPDHYRGPIHGIQLWVAQPSATRAGPPAFEHHPALPRLDLDRGQATILVGALADARSPARRDSDHVGVDLDLEPGTTPLPAVSEYEYALIVASGTVAAEGQRIVPGQLLYLGAGRDELILGATRPSRALLLGGVPFPEQLLMWWNFVARTRDEIDAAYDAWTADSGRFGQVNSGLPRIGVGRPPWRPSRS
jgi:redox-sensitive bicupin YhaK (pirin superfamily)